MRGAWCVVCAPTISRRLMLRVSLFLFFRPQNSVAFFFLSFFVVLRCRYCSSGMFVCLSSRCSFGIQFLDPATSFSAVFAFFDLVPSFRGDGVVALVN